MRKFLLDKASAVASPACEGWLGSVAVDCQEVYRPGSAATQPGTLLEISLSLSGGGVKRLPDDAIAPAGLRLLSKPLTIARTPLR